MRLLPTPKTSRTSRFSKKLETTAPSFVSRAATKKERRSKKTKTVVPELDFISKVCTRVGGMGNEKGTPDDQKANQLAARVSHTFYLFFYRRVDFPVWTRNGRGGQGPREDEVPATEQTLLPNLKILISVLGR